MMSTRDVLIFLAGAEAFHTLSHLWVAASGVLPLQIRCPRITVTAKLNLMAMIVNGLITAGLLWWVSKV